MSLHFTYNADFSNTTAGYTVGSTVGVREQIRFLLRDVGFVAGNGITPVARPFVLADEEIDWTQKQEMNAYMMAARCAESLVLRSVGVKSKKIGDLTIVYGASDWKALAAELRARGMTYQLPFCGGISLADKLATEADPDWIPPRIAITTFDNTGAEQPSAQTAEGNTSFPTV